MVVGGVVTVGEVIGTVAPIPSRPLGGAASASERVEAGLSPFPRLALRHGYEHQVDPARALDPACH